MSGWKLAKQLLLVLLVALVLAGIGMLVHVSRAPGGQLRVKATSLVDTSGCLSCHTDPLYKPEMSSRPWEEFLFDEEMLASSTHASIDCTRCHLTFATGQRISEQAVQKLCGQCHLRELELQEASVHADPRVATCLDCHSPGATGHDIPPILATESPAFPRNVAGTCGGCHADEKLMAGYGLETDVHEMYLDSPHGTVLELVGSDTDEPYPATCASCHGSHDVVKVDDPASPVSSTASLAGLCADCHPGATESFASTLALHKEFASEELSPVAHYGERFFFVLTASVVGLGMLMVSMEGIGWLTGRAYRGRGPGKEDRGGGGPGEGDIRGPSRGDLAAGDEPDDDPGDNPGSHLATADSAVDVQTDGGPAAFAATQALVAEDAAFSQRPDAAEEIARFDGQQRIQHLVMMVSLIVLATTGLPQKFPDWPVSLWFINFWGGLDSARSIHRFAGLVLITDCLYHLAYVAYSTVVLRKPLPIAMIPTPKDIADFFQDLQYWFGRTMVRPRFGRFSYREKFDYWAIFWGMPLIGISGLVLMFPVLASKLLPGDAVPVALVAHSDEALLAVCWIFIVHLFFVHLNPRFFPLNRAMFSGKMPRHLYAEEHPLELATLDARRGGRTGSGGRG